MASENANNLSLDENHFSVSPELVDEIIHALNEKQNEHLEFLLEPLHSADLADIFQQLNPSKRSALVSYLGGDMEPEVLSELDDTTRDKVITEMDDEDVVEAIRELESDDAIHVLEDMDEDEQRRIINALPDEDRAAIEEGLSYPEDSAGRLLQKNLISVPNSWNVSNVIDYLRDDGDLPEEFYEIFIVDPLHHPIGTISLSQIIRAGAGTVISEIMNSEPTVVPATMDQEEVAFLFKQYDMTSMGVVDDDGRLLGMIMVDDVVDVIEEEAKEDILRMGGVHETEITETVFEASKNRIVWLIINLGTAVLASVVIAMFAETIEQMVALAILFPIVASMGGNTGTQTMTVTVRSIATRELTSSNIYRIIGKEFLIASLNGVIMSLIISALVYLWFDHNLQLSLVIGAAMLLNMVVAGLAGILIPVWLDKANVDPALASSIFVTTITDVIGFYAFLGLAAVFLL
jgi:magnesium transporter